MSATVDDVLDDETRAALGDPVDEKPANALPAPYNNEVRWYDDGLITVATPAVNLAKEFSPTMDPRSGYRPEDLDPEKVLNWVKDQLSGPNENPVYVNDMVLDRMEADDRAAAYARFKGDPTAYPVRLRSRAAFFDRLDEQETVRLDDELRDHLGAALQENNVLVPALTYTRGDTLVPRWPAVIAYQEGTELVALEDDPLLADYVADEPGNPYDLHAHIEEDADGEPERITLDLSRFDPDAVAVRTTDTGLGVFVDGELVYTHHRMDAPEGAPRELHNGLYEISRD